MKSIVLTIVLGCAGLVSLADGPNRNFVNHDSGTADVSWVPDPNGNTLFHITYDNGSGSGFTVVVMDEYGDQLYRGYYTEKKFDRFFQIAEPESYGKLTFVIHNIGDNSSQRFEVSSTQRLVENVEVKEIK